MMKKRWWIVVLVAVVLLAAWLAFDSTFVLLNFRVVRRDAESVTLTGDWLPGTYALKKLKGPTLLDVRQISVAPEELERLRVLFPDTELRYSIALGKQGVDMDATDLTLSVADVPQLPAAMACLPKLKQVRVDGEGADWALLKGLIAQYPAVEFDFALNVCGVATRSTETVLDLGKVQVDMEELEQKLGCFTQLQRLLVPGCEEYERLLALREASPELDIFYTLAVNGVSTDTHAAQLALENVSLATLEEALPHLKGLQELSLTGILPSDEELYKLMGQYPQVDFLWDVTVCGVAANTGDTTLILSETWMPNTDEVREKLPYFCRLERVEMCYCGIPSAQMDALSQKLLLGNIALVTNGQSNKRNASFPQILDDGREFLRQKPHAAALHGRRSQAVAPFGQAAHKIHPRRECMLQSQGTAGHEARVQILQAPGKMICRGHGAIENLLS